MDAWCWRKACLHQIDYRSSSRAVHLRENIIPELLTGLVSGKVIFCRSANCTHKASLGVVCGNMHTLVFSSNLMHGPFAHGQSSQTLFLSSLTFTGSYHSAWNSPPRCLKCLPGPALPWVSVFQMNVWDTSQAGGCQSFTNHSMHATEPNAIIYSKFSPLVHWRGMAFKTRPAKTMK